MRCKRTGEIEYDLTKRKRFHLESIRCSFEKKNEDFLPFFQALSLFSRLFPGLQNCWTNFETFSRIQDCANSGSKNGYYFCVILRSNTSRNSNTSKANREKGKVKTFRTLSAVSATLKTSDVSLNLRFSVGTKPSRKMLIPVKMKIH